MKKPAIILVATLLAMLCALPIIRSATAAGNNLIPNPSVETGTTTPDGWNSLKSGTNTTAFSYLTTGHSGSRSLKTQITKRSSGQAGWEFTPVAVTPSTKYTFTDWYQSNVQSTIAVVVTRTTGATVTQTTHNVAASTAWKQATVSFTTPAKAAKVTIYHYLNRVGQLTTDDFDLEGPAPVVPTVILTAPANGATVQNTQTLTATATNTVGVQFKVDGTSVGAEDTSAPYSVSWNSKTVANGSHTVTATARSSGGLTSTATATINVQNSTPPTVSLTAPVSGSTVSGTTQTVSANASDTVQVSGVQFKLDGTNLGTEDTTAPYSVNWDTTQTTNGSHSLTAVARNSAGLTTTSAAVAVTVQNTVTTPVTPPVTPPAGPNLISNPSFETANGSVPANWLSSNWGTNTSSFTYLTTGHTGTRSVKVETTAYTDGAANWYYADIPVTAGKTYKYENWYQSNVDTEVDAEIVMNDGSVQYAWLGTVLANTNWTKFSTTYTIPAGAKSIAIYQILAKKGYIISDDYSLSEYTPAPLNRALVSVTFDDGWANQYINALPVLQQLGIKSTYYIITNEVKNPTPVDGSDYMNQAQVKALFAAGNEIGSHTKDHCELTTGLTEPGGPTCPGFNLDSEMHDSRTVLEGLVGAGNVTDFAYPYGSYNATTIAAGQKYYKSQRSINAGLNTKDNLDVTQLKIYEVDSNVTQAQVKGWIDAANAEHAWLILLYHEVANKPADPGDAQYTAKVADFTAEMNYLKQTGVTTVTVNQALNEILPQL